jgi:hypothetical protein
MHKEGDLIISAFPLVATVKAGDEVSHRLVSPASLHLEINSLFRVALLAGEEADALS